MIDFYKENGYLIVKNFLSDTEHNHLLDVSDTISEQGKSLSRSSEPTPKGYKIGRFQYNKNNTMNKLDGACEYHPAFFNLACNDTLIDTAQALTNIGNDVDVYISKFFPMEPNGGQSTLMHQDNFYFNGNPNNIISCAVYLQDTDVNNGCLRICKGSHKEGIFLHNIQSDMRGIKWISNDIVNRYEIIDIKEKAPYAVFFNINTIHGCYVNKSNDTRYSLAWDYISSSNDKVVKSAEAWCDRKKVR